MYDLDAHIVDHEILGVTSGGGGGSVTNLDLPYTTSSAIGVINAGTVPWMHNFTNPTGFVDASIDSLANARNLFLGFKAGNFTLSGTAAQGRANIGIGHFAAPALTTGIQNIGIGWQALHVATTGNYNTAFGTGALQAVVSGTSNSAFGAASLISATGSNNIGVGDSAGGTIITGSNNTILGVTADVSSGALTNATALGFGAVVDASNKVVIGNTSVTVTETRGNLAIRDQASGFKATIDVSGLGSSQTFNLLNATAFPAGYFVLGAGTPGVVPLLTGNGSELIDSGYTWDPGAGTPFGAIAANKFTISGTGTSGVLEIGDGGGGLNAFQIQRDTASSNIAFTSTGGVAGNYTFLRGTLTTRRTTLQDAIAISPRSGGVSGFSLSMTTAALTSSRTATFPDATGTVALTSDLPVGANPTASLGLSAINGSASTFMRSDGAPALDVTIAPTWTAVHTFSSQDVHNAGVSLGTNGGLTRAALSNTAATPNITITPSWTATANTAGDIGLLIKPDQAMGANASIFQVQNNSAAQLFDIRRLGPAGASNSQLRFGFDSSNYYNLSVSSTGVISAQAVGSANSFTFQCTGNLAFLSTAGDVTFQTISTQAFRFITGLSMVMADGMVISNAANTTGLKIGAAGDKLGFYSVAPVARPAAYTPTNVTADRAYDANATTIDELADVVGTLIADLQSLGLVQ